MLISVELCAGQEAMKWADHLLILHEQFGVIGVRAASVFSCYEKGAGVAPELI